MTTTGIDADINHGILPPFQTDADDTSSAFGSTHSSPRSATGDPGIPTSTQRVDTETPIRFGSIQPEELASANQRKTSPLRSYTHATRQPRFDSRDRPWSEPTPPLRRDGDN